MGLMFPLYFFSFIVSSGMALSALYQILELSDLDCDHISPQKCSRSLNNLVLPELLCVGLMVALHVLVLNWIPVLTTLPMFAWLLYLYRSTPSGQMGVFDPRSLCERIFIKKHVRSSAFKIVFHLIHLLVYMYFAVTTLNLT